MWYLGIITYLAVCLEQLEGFQLWHVDDIPRVKFWSNKESGNRDHSRKDTESIFVDPWLYSTQLGAGCFGQRLKRCVVTIEAKLWILILEKILKWPMTLMEVGKQPMAACPADSAIWKFIWQQFRISVPLFQKFGIDLEWTFIEIVQNILAPFFCSGSNFRLLLQSPGWMLIDDMNTTRGNGSTSNLSTRKNARTFHTHRWRLKGHTYQSVFPFGHLLLFPLMVNCN